MLSPPSDQEKTAIARVALSDEGQAFIEYLRLELAARDVQNRTLYDNDAYRGQGRALQLAEIIDLLDNARLPRY